MTEAYLLIGGQRGGEMVDARGDRFLRIRRLSPFTPRSMPSGPMTIEYDEYEIRTHSRIGAAYVLKSLSDLEATEMLESYRDD